MIHLQLETTSVCNAACCFCPYPIMQRAKGLMPMPLFERIIADAATVPLIDRISLVGLGEPTLDRFLVQRIEAVRRSMAAIWLDVVTNGSLLTRKLIDQLIAAGLTQLSISLNAVTREKRRAIMQLDDFDRVVEMCHYAIAAGAGRMKVVVKGLNEKDLMEAGDLAQFAETWGERAFLHLEGNWAGSMRKARIPMAEACHRALSQIMVLWDGRVSLCCFDAEGAEILGDLRTQTLREVFNGGRALEIRTAHAEGRRAEIPLCAGCTTI